jgi:adenylate cyclase
VSGEFAVPLESIRHCLRGVVPSQIATCSADGVPNVTTLSIVHYVDSGRVALTRQFFNKTSVNLRENPRAQVVVVDVASGEQFLLDTEFLHTETEGATFDAVEANLDAVASQSGMTGVFRLRGVDIHRVLACVAFDDAVVVAPDRHWGRNAIVALDELARRLSLCADYAQATQTALEALADLFGFEQSILFAIDGRGERLFAVTSSGYATSAAGAEIVVGAGAIGVAAARRRVVCVPSMARGRSMNAAMAQTIEEGAGPGWAPASEIPLPELDRAQSSAAVPLVARAELTGVLYLESERAGEFGPGDERLLRLIGNQLAAALAGLQADERDGTAVAESPQEPVAVSGPPIAVTYYQADDTIFIDGDYVVKGVAGRILWKVLREHAADGRTAFTNREVRLDEQLGLPAGNENLEARLLLLRKRLDGIGGTVQLERVGRGRFELRISGPVTLSEVATAGPMRAAHAPADQ